ncbi:hypothetical protein J7E63_24990 [Bacillus sp. ISL-75]|uniref:hypothetical protein n=1 Tax=Bacillus sp. ISL-75 TaxID=2819137 RepID=UPI001BE6039F|nr:hypothetical protein [Bacillus sp. ISL-75]MBT2730118.1 hypothetical protein [Bacillus sp. ISL-75]
MKKMIVLLTILLMFVTGSLANAEAPEPKNNKEAQDWYVTSEDIIRDIMFPSIDKRIMKEYPGNDSATFGWQARRIVGINYNWDHSYDVSVAILIPKNSNSPLEYAEDLVKVRISPSCDSPKIGCKHGFKVEVLEYKHKSSG